MNDTLPEIQKYYYHLIMSKTPGERFLMGLEMMEAGRSLMISGIKLEHPEMTDNEISVELLNRQRRYDKSLDWLDHVLPRC